MDFWKMNGAGNDFIVIDNRTLLHYSQQQLADHRPNRLPPAPVHRRRRPNGRGHAPRQACGLPDAVFQLRRLRRRDVRQRRPLHLPLRL